MHVWRICRRRFAADSLLGEGARLYGGRWNSRGVPMIYTSTSLALAAVETFVNLEPKLRPDDLVSLEAEIPTSVRIDKLDLRLLPLDWHRMRDESVREFGNTWIHKGESAALLVPSAAIRGDWNVLLNPLHTEFRLIDFKKPQPFDFDTRMFE